MRRIALMFVAITACAETPTAPSGLAGSRFELANVSGEELPAFVYDFLGDDVTAASGELSFSATGFERYVVTCIDTGTPEPPCSTVVTVGTWTQTGDTIKLTRTLDPKGQEEPLAAVNGSTLTYKYRDRLYEWVRR